MSILDVLELGMTLPEGYRIRFEEGHFVLMMRRHTLQIVSATYWDAVDSAWHYHDTHRVKLKRLKR